MKVTSRKLDVFGFATLSIAIGALQLFLDRGEVLDWFDSVEIRIEFFAAVIAFAFFLVHTLTTSNASFFNRELARDRNFVTGCARRPQHSQRLTQGYGATAPPYTA